jgi:hypothetical protein
MALQQPLGTDFSSVVKVLGCPVATQRAEPGCASASFRRAGSARSRVRPARAIGLGPRYSEQRANARQTSMTAPAPDPPGPRPDQRERRSARHDAAPPDVERAPTASGHGRRQDRSGPRLPAAPHAAHISPTGRRPRSPQRPGAPLASPHDANHTAPQEIAQAPPPPRSPRARTRGCRDAATRRRHSAHRPPPWRAAARSTAAYVVDRRSTQRTCRRPPWARPTAWRHRLEVAPQTPRPARVASGGLTIGAGRGRRGDASVLSTKAAS